MYDVCMHAGSSNKKGGVTTDACRCRMMIGRNSLTARFEEQCFMLACFHTSSYVACCFAIHSAFSFGIFLKSATPE